MRDLESVIKTLAEAAQLRDELLEALPEFPAERQLEVRALIHQLEWTLRTLGFAVGLAVQDAEA